MNKSPLVSYQSSKPSENGLEDYSKVDCLLSGLQRFSSLPDLLILACIGLVLHLLASYVAPMLTGYPGRGNPAMWYPTCAWALVCFLLLRRKLLPVQGYKRSLPLLFALLTMFVLISMAHTVYAFPNASLDKLVTRNVAVLILSAVALVIMGLSVKRTAALFIPALLMCGWFLFSGIITVGFIACGVAAFVTLTGFIYLDRAESLSAADTTLTSQ